MVRQKCSGIRRSYLGDRFGGLVNDDIDNPELKLYDPDSFNEAAGILIYEKIFNR
ncbi:hypothetical protein HV269_05320 [Citrobacter sp. RHBSTW-00696]|uniref:hypothetical protein n=1 Tax=Citrobacter sp. RHBSTW-00696 TaxID=2742662 RepID=UPI0015EA4A12|nr:hypothetical protein [Citrobacter sp. RHBSTW-00696]QLU48906.1 hypothetical protein HV269_05320 [Citrobacter sp. RHBSTW-00696]